MRINVTTNDNGYVVSREQSGGLNGFEIFFEDFDEIESFLIALLEHDECIAQR